MLRLAGVNCSDAKLYFWTILQFFFIRMGPGPPTSNFFGDFLNFFNFAKPLEDEAGMCSYQD